jgi:hypothetical protein
LRLCGRYFLFLLVLVFLSGVFSQTKSTNRLAFDARPRLDVAEAKGLLEEAIGIVCTQAKLDPKSSVAIDEMQARPSLPFTVPKRKPAPNARNDFCRSQKLWSSVRCASSLEYGFQKSPKFHATAPGDARVNNVKRVRP